MYPPRCYGDWDANATRTKPVTLLLPSRSQGLKRDAQTCRTVNHLPGRSKVLRKCPRYKSPSWRSAKAMAFTSLISYEIYLTYASAAVSYVWVLCAVQEGKPVATRRRPRGVGRVTQDCDRPDRRLGVAKNRTWMNML
ncbi:hypothetical protein AG1IA_09659 [Rhizoctonia solani AG-1 IA]|uniref:Uncharacterized protein n=1 Tax=Thanatephorus cucumeris (strain AG1-IA) TaxID=983506 RepID=L8WDS4_THACA|nr:hypothetical protein AG1IA_09659 [Rhizoctonia solani AG-1 IA]